jgi:predicted transposase YdaD
MEKGEIKGRAEGRAEGKLEGAREQALAMARALLDDGKELTWIALMTGLSLAELERLKESPKSSPSN